MTNKTTAALKLAEQEKQEPIELQEVKRVVEEGSGFWRECSGCYESNEGAPPNGAVFSKAFDCYLGNGCSECGGLGAIWDNTDYEEMARFMAAQDAAPVSAPEQEPVAIVDAFQIRQLAYELPTGTKLYAAPVSAKREWVDLTPIELAEAFSDKGSADAGIRAVIAAFKEKNK